MQGVTDGEEGSGANRHYLDARFTQDEVSLCSIDDLPRSRVGQTLRTLKNASPTIPGSFLRHLRSLPDLLHQLRPLPPSQRVSSPHEPLRGSAPRGKNAQKSFPPCRTLRKQGLREWCTRRGAE